MKKVFAYIYFIYVGIIFFACLLIMLILYVPLLLIRNDRMRMKIIYLLNKIFMKWIWSNLAGIWMTVQGREKIDNDKTYAFVCNHSNLIDIPITSSVIDTYYKPLVKKEMMSVPVLGPLLRMTSIPVDRKSPESRRKSFEKMVSSMKNGLSLLVFPEGTRNRTADPTKEFYDGAFKAAILAQANIAPFVLINVRHLQPVDSQLIYPGKVTIRFLDPISTVGMTEADTKALSDRVHAMIDAVLMKEDVLFKDGPHKDLPKAKV
ncbi:MAG: phospholipid/glycerol acyltransferase [Bacteroidetes bacterium]|nr:phospholipid/glycerol acyltransferase [Bacteroidota bacterium]